MARRTVFLGFSCNNRCIVCAQGDLRASAPPASIEEASRTIDAAEPGDVLCFVGGEPTLVGELPDLLRRAADRPSVSALLQTNGRRLAYPAYADVLAQASRQLSLDVSLFGSSAAMHDYHASSPGSFAQTARGIQNARARGMPVGVSVVVTRSNFRHLVEVVRLVRALGADALRLARLEPLGSARASLLRISPNEELARPLLEAAAAEGRRLGVQVTVGEPGETGPQGRFAGLGPTA